MTNEEASKRYIEHYGIKEVRVGIIAKMLNLVFPEGVSDDSWLEETEKKLKDIVEGIEEIKREKKDNGQ